MIIHPSLSLFFFLRLAKDRPPPRHHLVDWHNARATYFTLATRSLFASLVTTTTIPRRLSGAVSSYLSSCYRGSSPRNAVSFIAIFLIIIIKYFDSISPESHVEASYSSRIGPSKITSRSCVSIY